MLIDTSGLLCLIDRRDERHARAGELYAGAPAKLTHSYVLAEFVPLARRRGVPRESTILFARGFLDDPDLNVVWVDLGLHGMALDLLERRADKDYSLCDAVSFLLMRQLGEREGLTTDAHFAQEGFVRLLGP